MAAGRRFTHALLLVQLLAAAAAMLVHPSPSPAVLASAGDVARWAFVLAIAAVAAAVIGASAVWGAHLRLRWWGAAIVVLGAAALFVYVSYDEARDARTCPYLGGQVVV